MRSFVINLDRATARLAWMNEAFDKMGLEFERFPALDGGTLPDETIDEVIGPGSRHWARAEIACFLSHVALWKQIAAGDETYAAVFEDDVHFASSARQFLRSSSWIPDGIDVIKLETTLHPVRIGRRHHDVLGHRLQLLRGFHSGAAGYILSRRAAASLVAATSRIEQPIDNFLFDMGHGFACWQMNPALCIQDMFLPGGATILPSGVEQERFAARSAGPWKPRRSLAARVSRELRRLSWTVDRPRIITIPVQV